MNWFELSFARSSKSLLSSKDAAHRWVPFVKNVKSNVMSLLILNMTGLCHQVNTLSIDSRFR